MGKLRYAPHLLRFADVANEPCVYVAELSNGIVKVGASGGARARMMSLASELQRDHDSELTRFHIAPRRTFKAACEAETRLVWRVAEIATVVPGRREFFEGVSFDAAVILCAEVCSGRPAQKPTVRSTPVKKGKVAAIRLPRRPRSGGRQAPPVDAYLEDLRAGLTLDQIAKKHGKANASVIYTPLARRGLPTCRAAASS